MDTLKTKQTTIFTIAATARKKGVKNAHQLSQMTGISPPRALRLWRGRGKLDAEDLNVLCDKLRCRIYDLIKRLPNSSGI